MPSCTTLVVLSLVPVVAPAVALLAVQTVVTPYIAAASTATRTLLKKEDPEDAATSSSTAPAATRAGDAPAPHSLPETVLAPDAPYVVTCERLVSRPVPAAALTAVADGEEKPASLLTAYLRGTMGAFTWTPHGLLIRALAKDPARRHTFDADLVHSLDYAVGDRVAGIHEVAYRGDGVTLSSRAELTLGAVPEWPQLTVHGIIVAEVVRCGSDVVFINETWMWRDAQTEKPTLLESTPGRWVHRLVGGWLLFKGTKAVTKK